MSEGPIPNSWREAIPVVIWVVFILGFGLLLIDSLGQLFKDPFYRVLFALCGLVGFLAMLIHRKWLLEHFNDLSGGSVLAAIIVVLIVLALSPYVEQQRLPFSHWFAATPPSTADEIADAIVRKLPRGGSVPSGATTIATAPYVNPLHENITKWQIVHGLKMGILRNNVNAGCKIIVVRYPEAYSEDYAADFKEILDVIGWKYDERFADRTLEKGLSVHMIGVPGPSMECGTALALRLHNDMRTRSGSSPNIGPTPLLETDAPDYLRNCPAGCVEVDFGNEDTSR